MHGRFLWTVLKKNKKESNFRDNRSPPSKEVLEQVKRSADTNCGHRDEVLKEKSRKERKLCEWTFEGLGKRVRR